VCMISVHNTTVIMTEYIYVSPLNKEDSGLEPKHLFYSHYLVENKYSYIITIKHASSLLYHILRAYKASNNFAVNLSSLIIKSTHFCYEAI